MSTPSSSESRNPRKVVLNILTGVVSALVVVIFAAVFDPLADDGGRADRAQDAHDAQSEEHDVCPRIAGAVRLRNGHNRLLCLHGDGVGRQQGKRGQRAGHFGDMQRHELPVRSSGRNAAGSML